MDLDFQGCRCLVSAWSVQLIMDLPDYAELHCLSNFTFLRGASHPEELVAQAVALTDECSLAGVVRAHLAAKAAGLKFIVGSEMTTAMESTTGSRTIESTAGPGPINSTTARTVNRLKLVFLASNRHGYGNLSALITLARRRAGKGEYTLYRGDLESFAPSGGVPDCLAASGLPSNSTPGRMTPPGSKSCRR